MPSTCSPLTISLPLRDAVHAAVALNRGATLIASADRHFDRIPELARGSIRWTATRYGT